MKKLKIINPERVRDNEAKKYRNRRASRAIVVDRKGRIALLDVSRKKYFKLPGGKIEKGEDRLSALKRECKEEIGCDIEVIDEIGFITEYRKIFKQKQTSYCYLAKVKGRKTTTSFTKKENERSYRVKWLTYNNAMKVMEKSKKVSKEGGLYIIPRDMAFLKEAKKLFLND